MPEFHFIISCLIGFFFWEYDKFTDNIANTCIHMANKHE